MNYIEIINKTLIEINYAPVASFSDLTKMEHKRLMNIINRLNKEICNASPNFYFRQVVKKMKLYPDKTEYALDISGKISKIVGKNGEYFYEADYAKFYQGIPPENAYSFYGGKYIFPKSGDELRIFYSTDDFVLNKNDEFKPDFEKADDRTIIPDNFAEKLLVNGGAYNFKQNSAHPKYAHWKQEYDKALAELLSGAKKISGTDIIIDGGYRKL